MLQRLTDNAAARLGPARFNWWPQWQGKRVAIVACGPSLRNVDLSILRGRLPVLAIKEAAVDKCPWADVVYGCDWPWWRYRRGLPSFKGIKLAWATQACDEFPDIKRVIIADKERDSLLFDEPLSIGAGGNSGFQVLNLAAQFGASGIVLIGFDMTGAHFYGRNNWSGAKNPHDGVFSRWLKAFANSATQLESIGIEVVNANAHGLLECFPRKPLDHILKDLSL
jgi:hypothetical protein